MTDADGVQAWTMAGRPKSALTIYLAETKEKLRAQYPAVTGLQLQDLALIRWKSPGIDQQRKAELVESQAAAMQEWIACPAELRSSAPSPQHARAAVNAAAAGPARKKQKRVASGAATAGQPSGDSRSAFRRQPSGAEWERGPGVQGGAGRKRGKAIGLLEAYIKACGGSASQLRSDDEPPKQGCLSICASLAAPL